MLTETTRFADFPTLSGIHYLNTAAESIPPRCTHEALEAYWRDKCRGMSGREAHFARVEACREVCARLLGLDQEEVGFCSCSSEAYNLLAGALDLAEADEVVITDLDFPAGSTPWLRAARRPVRRVWRAEEGALCAEALAPLLNQRTRLVQVSLVSFLNGHRLHWAPFLSTVRAQAPQALVAVDITQAFGRVELDCAGADIVISSTHKWTLGIHGGCVIGVPRRNAEQLTTRAGGWFHLRNAFDADRFERAIAKTGAASFATGMPNFAALYALDASLRYLESIGIAAIAKQADALTAQCDAGLRALGMKPMCAWEAACPSGIVAFQHERSAELHQALEAAGVQVMHHAGRLRIAVHGYNTQADVDALLRVLAKFS